MTVWNVAAGESIQAAINAAADGDTINIAAGTYREQVRAPTRRARRSTTR